MVSKQLFSRIASNLPVHAPERAHAAAAVTASSVLASAASTVYTVLRCQRR